MITIYRVRRFFESTSGLLELEETLYASESWARGLFELDQRSRGVRLPFRVTLETLQASGTTFSVVSTETWTRP